MPGTEIKIDNFAFVPASVIVKAGTRVIRVNHDDTPHTIDSTEGKFRSGALDTDDHFQFLFSDPGEHQFLLSPASEMTGKIIVHLMQFLEKPSCSFVFFVVQKNL